MHCAPHWYHVHSYIPGITRLYSEFREEGVPILVAMAFVSVRRQSKEPNTELQQEENIIVTCLYFSYLFDLEVDSLYTVYTQQVH